MVQGDTKAAKEQYAIAYRIDSTDTMIQTIIGEAYYHERDFPRAIEQWTRVTRLEPRQTFAHRYLGRAYEANGQFEQALAAYEMYELVRSGEIVRVRERYARYRKMLHEKGAVRLVAVGRAQARERGANDCDSAQHWSTSLFD